jgi:TP901 family phage tail tape measure protein
MGLNSLGLGFLFTATDLASGVMQTVNKNFKGLEEQSGQTIAGLDGMIKKLGAGLATMAIGVGGLKASFALAETAGTFEQSLAAVGAVANSSAEELKDLRKAAIEAGKKTQFSPTQAVLGLNELAQAGYDAKESINLLDPVLKLAAGSLGDLSPQDAAGLASQALKAFGIDASLAGRAVDQLLQSANAFAVKPKDLALGLGTASSGAQTLNQSLTETVIAFGLVKNIIPGTERAATSVKVAMERLADSKVQLMLRKQKVAVLDANGGYRQFLDIIKDLMPAMAKMSEGERGEFLMKVFGTEGLGGVNAMFAQFETGLKGADGKIRKGGDAIDYLRKQFAGANGVAEQFSDKLLATYEGSKTLLSGSMETLAILIGEPFMDVLKPVVQTITTMVNAIIDVLDGMSPEVKRFFAGLVVGASALLTLGGAILLVEEAGPLLGIGLKLIGGALKGLAIDVGAALIAMWPFILAGIAIAAVVYAIQNNVGGVGDAWDRLAEKFSGGGKVIGAIFETVKNWAVGLWNTFKDGFAEMWDSFGPLFEDLGHAFDTLGEALSHVGALFDDTSSGPGQGMLTFVKFLGKAIGWLVGLLVSAIGWIALFAAAYVEIVAGIGSILKPIIQGISDAITIYVDKILKMIDKVKEAWRMVQGVFGVGTSSGTRGLASKPEDHSNDAAGQSKTRGLSDGKPAPYVAPTLADMGGGRLDQKPAAGSAAAAAALAAEQSQYANNPAYTFDYEKMAAANAKTPIAVSVNIDGEKVAAAVARGQRSAAAREGRADVGER